LQIRAGSVSFFPKPILPESARHFEPFLKFPPQKSEKITLV
jgi:hypothetical protein